VKQPTYWPVSVLLSDVIQIERGFRHFLMQQQIQSKCLSTTFKYYWNTAFFFFCTLINQPGYEYTGVKRK